MPENSHAPQLGPRRRRQPRGFVLRCRPAATERRVGASAAAETGVKVWYRLSLREKGGKVHPAGPLLIQKFTSDGNIG